MWAPSAELCLSLAAGIFLGRFYGITPLSVLLLTLVSIIMMLVSSIRPGFRAVIPLFCAVGLALSPHGTDGGELKSGMSFKVAELSGRVEGALRYYKRGYRFTLDTGCPPVSGVDDDCFGVVQVSVANGDNPPLPGDAVSIGGVRLKRPVGFRNFGGFDYERYLAERGIAFRASVYDERKIRVTARGGSLRPERIGEGVRRSLGGFIEERFSGENAAIAEAMSVGIVGKLDSATRRKFVESGLAHLLAVSGLHVGFIAGLSCLVIYFFMFHLLYRAHLPSVEKGRHGAVTAFLTIVVIAIFVLSTGYRVSAVRAGIMAAVYLACVMFSREKEVLNAIFLSAIIVMLLEPAALFSASFLLSYAAVLAIVFVFAGERREEDELPALKSAWRKIAERGAEYALKTVMITVAVSLLTAPILLSFFSELHLGGIMANVFAIPLAGVAVSSIWVAWMLNAAAPVLGDLALLPGMVSVGGINLLADFFSAWKGFSFFGPPMNIWTLAVYYLSFLGFFLSARRRWIFMPVPLLILLISCMPRGREGAEIHMFDVGQGEAVLVMLQDGRNILIDGGAHAGGFDAGELIIVPALRRLSIKRLDAVIATHGDADHAGGIASVLRTMDVGMYYDHGAPAEGGPLRGARETARAKGIAYGVLRTGMSVAEGEGGSLEVVHPSADFLSAHPDAADNDVSIVLKLEAEGVSMLLTGDIERGAEEYLLEMGDGLRADVLKAAHHGSNSSSGSGFLGRISPRLALISAGKGNRWHFPSKKVLERMRGDGIRALVTSEEGEIKLRFVDGKIHISTWSRPDIFRHGMEVSGGR